MAGQSDVSSAARLAVCLLAICLTHTGLAQTGLAETGVWQSDPTDSSLEFAAYYEGERLPGRFQRFSATLEADQNGSVPQRLRVEVTMASANMNDDEVNAELLGAAFFNTAAFPTAEFESSAIRSVDGGWLALGTLRIRNRTRTIELPFSWKVDGGSAVLDGELSLSRTEWGVGSGDWADTSSLADRVDLHYRAAFAPGGLLQPVQ